MRPLNGPRAPPTLFRSRPDRPHGPGAPRLRRLRQASARLGFPFGPFARLALLTAQRRTEVLGMRWEERQDRSGSRPCWVIPGERMKMGRVQTLPLVPAAVAVLRDLPMQEEGFVLSTTGRTPASGLSKAKARLEALAAARLGQPILDWRWHDSRRTAATAMQACGIPVEVTERVLGHRSGTVSGVAAVDVTPSFPPAGIRAGRLLLRMSAVEAMGCVAESEGRAKQAIAYPVLRRTPPGLCSQERFLIHLDRWGIPIAVKV